MHSHGYFPRRNEKKTCKTLYVMVLDLYCLVYSLKMAVLHTVYSLFFFLGEGWGAPLFNVLSLKGGWGEGGGTNSSIYAVIICHTWSLD